MSQPEQPAPKPKLAPEPPSLHEILLAMRQDTFQLRKEVAALHESIQAMALNLLKRRLPSGQAPTETPAELAADVQKRLDSYWAQLKRPMKLHDLMRLFLRRTGELHATRRQILDLMPNVHEFPSATGASMIIPGDAWDSLPLTERASWLGATYAEIREKRRERLKGIAATEDFHREWEARERAERETAERLRSGGAFIEPPSVSAPPNEASPQAPSGVDPFAPAALTSGLPSDKPPGEGTPA